MLSVEQSTDTTPSSGSLFNFPSFSRAVLRAQVVVKVSYEDEFSERLLLNELHFNQKLQSIIPSYHGRQLPSLSLCSYSRSLSRIPPFFPDTRIHQHILSSSSYSSDLFVFLLQTLGFVPGSMQGPDCHRRCHQHLPQARSPLLLLSSLLFSSLRSSPLLFSSHLFSPLLFSSLLLSHLISSHLFASLLFSIPLSSRSNLRISRPWTPLSSGLVFRRENGLSLDHYINSPREFEKALSLPHARLDHLPSSSLVLIIVISIIRARVCVV